MGESEAEIRRIIEDLYSLAGLKASTANEWFEDCELYRDKSAYF